MGVLRRLWQGKYALPVTFWLFYCVGLFACMFLSGILVFLGLEISSSSGFDARPIARASGLALVYGYLLIATVGVWRSAGPDLASPIWLSRIWAGAARLVVAAWVAMIAFRLADGGALRVLQWIMGDMDA